MQNKPMLAKEMVLKYVEEHFNNDSNEPLYIQPKFDGIRMLCHNGIAYSRSLKPLPNRHLQSIVSTYASYFEGLDGEITFNDSSNPLDFNKAHSITMTRDTKLPTDIRYTVFDMWNRQNGYNHDNELWNAFDKLTIEQHKLKIYCALKQTYPCSDIDELNTYESNFIQSGYEGAILRKGNCHYKHGRSTARELALIKMKRFHDAEAVIIGAEELMHNANEAEISETGYQVRSSHKENMIPSGKLGALVVTWNNKKFNLGTGFNDQTRIEFWDIKDKLIQDKQTVKFKYKNLGSKGNPLFPVFLGLRND